MSRNSVKSRVLALALSAVLVVSAVWTGILTLNTSAAGEKYYPLSGFTSGTRPKENPWYYNAANFSENPTSSVPVPDDFSKPVTLVPSSIKTAKAPEVTVAEAGEGKLNAALGFSEMTAEEYKLNLYSVNSETGDYELVKSDKTTEKAFTYSDLTAESRYAVQVLGLDGGKLSAVSDTVVFTLSVEETSNFHVANDGGDTAMMTPRLNAFSSAEAVEYADSPTGSAYACKYRVNSGGTGYVFETIGFYVDIKLNTEAIPSFGSTALAIWVDASDADRGAAGDKTPLTDFKLKNSENGKELAIFDKSTADKYILIDADGNKSELANSKNQGLFLPHGFKGYLLLPLDPMVDYSVYNQLYIKRCGDKAITFKKDDSDRTLYMSAFGMVAGTEYANITAADLYVPDTSKGMHLNTLEAAQDTYESCSDFNGTDTLGGEFGVSYKFFNSIDARAINAVLNDNGANKYGISLEFRAPESAIYDLGQALGVVNNGELAGRLYYRVTRRRADKTQNVLWPQGGGWHTLDVTEDDRNPSVELSAVEAELAKGESLMLEAYFDAEGESGGKLEISLGSPAVTSTDKKYDYKGSSGTYLAEDYHFYKRTDGNGGYKPLADRFSFNVMNYNEGEVEVLPADSYRTDWANSVNSGRANGCGYIFDAARGKLKVSLKRNSGVSLDFNVPESGSATLTANGNHNETVYARVLKNDEVIYPKSGGWQQFASDTVFNVIEEVTKGDRLTLQYYSTNEKEVAFTLNNYKVSLSGGNEYNKPGDSEYGALLERPYNNRDYKGKFEAADGSVWSFGILNGSKNGTVVNAVNYYDYSRTNMLYHNSDENVGYHFTDNQLTFDAAGASGDSMQDGKGFSITANIKESSLYDLSTALSIISGSGNVKFRIKKNGNKIWPEDSDWYTLVPTVGTANIPAIECAAAAGDTFVFEGMAVTAGRNDKVTVGLGSPAVRKIAPKVAEPEGYKLIYSPSDYMPVIDKNYAGAFVQGGARWSYALTDKSGSAANADYYNSINGFIGNAGGTAGVTFTEAGLKARLDGSHDLILEFTAPGNGYAAVNLPFAAAEGVSYTVSVDGRQIYPESGSAPADGNVPDISGVRILSGQRLQIKLSSGSAKEADLGMVSVAFTTDHDNAAEIGETSFGALYASPYGTDNYNGGYSPQEGLWNFNTVDSEGNVGSTNYYSSNEGRHLYNTEHGGAGYYFGEDALSAELKLSGGNAYGFSLGFVSPETELFDFNTDFTLESASSVTAKLFMRAVIDGKTIWPKNGKWFETEASGGETVKFPAFEADTVKGGKVVIEAYAAEINGADSIRVRLGNPTFAKSKADFVETPDALARVYASQSYNPFGDLSYTGPYTPVEGRWNYEILDATDPDDLKVLKANNYNSVTKLISNTNANNVGFYVGVSGSVGNSEISHFNGRNYGTNLRFVSPVSGEVLISGAAYVNSAANMPAGAKVRFRVMINDEVRFPADGGWMEMTDELRSSGFGGIQTEVDMGDEIIYQCYVDTDADCKISVLVNKPSIVLVTSTSSPKSAYNARNDFTQNYQISPFWSYEYSVSKKNIEYKQLESYGNDNYWMAAGLKQYTTETEDPETGEIKKTTKTEKLGAGSGDLWVCNSLDGSDPGIAAYRFDVPVNGSYTITSGKKLSTNFAAGRMLARITVNGKKVWPEDSDWLEIAKGQQIDFGRFIIEDLFAGDIVRFEASVREGDVPSFDQNKVFWTPVISKGKIDNAVNIYYGLNDAELAFFKGIETDKQFDADYEKNRTLAEILKNHKPESGNNNGGGSTGDSTYIPGTPGTSGTPGTPGYWVPGEDDIINRVIKKTIITHGMPIWAVVLIIAGSVAAAGGAVTLIILKKKGIIGKKKSAAGKGGKNGGQ